MRYLPKPRGLWRLERAFPPRYANKPENAITVSLCGTEVPWGGITLEADPDRDYDWSALRSFYVLVAVRPGVDATRTIKALHPIAEPCLTVVDVEQWRCWSLIALTPRLVAAEERMQSERPDGWK